MSRNIKGRWNGDLTKFTTNKMRNKLLTNELETDENMGVSGDPH